MKKHSSGFTLMELLIVVVIVGLLAAVAFPNYRAYGIRARRAEAAGDMLELSSFLERQFTATGRYDDAGNPGNLENPLPFNQSPREGDATAYNFSFVAGAGGLNATAFILRAVPTGGQTQDTECGELQINQNGIKCILGNSKCAGPTDSAADRKAVGECW